MTPKRDKQTRPNSHVPKKELSDWQKKLLEVIKPEELMARLDLTMERVQEAEALLNKANEAIRNAEDNITALHGRVIELEKKNGKLWARVFFGR